jgi:hypothetical protein
MEITIGTTDHELTKQIEKHRIFGMFTATSMLRFVKEISKIECEKFFKWFAQWCRENVDNISGMHFEDIWDSYIQHISSSKNTNQVAPTNQ